MLGFTEPVRTVDRGDCADLSLSKLPQLFLSQFRLSVDFAPPAEAIGKLGSSIRKCGMQLRDVKHSVALFSQPKKLLFFGENFRV